ncbi:MAG TPA: sugar phosphate isomerase/epimerase, partial [Bryobacteraceae bacterium]
MHRREFLERTIGAFAAASASFASPNDKPIPIGLNTYCLRAMKWHDMELIDYTAGLKLDSIFLQDSVDPGLMDPAHWAKVREYAHEKGLERLET